MLFNKKTNILKRLETIELELYNLKTKINCKKYKALVKLEDGSIHTLKQEAECKEHVEAEIRLRLTDDERRYKYTTNKGWTQRSPIKAIKIEEIE